MVSRRKALITIGSTVSTVAIAGCSGESGEVDTEGSGNGGGGEVVFHNVELTSDTIDDAVVEGEATNELGSEETIIISARFFDEEGTILGDGFESFHEEIPDGTRFQFEIISTVEYDNVADYDVEWETGF